VLDAAGAARVRRSRASRPGYKGANANECESRRLGNGVGCQHQVVQVQDLASLRRQHGKLIDWHAAIYGENTPTWTNTWGSVQQRGCAEYGIVGVECCQSGIPKRVALDRHAEYRHG